ncbi:hypothetical protein BH09MYX1_BH09MYX1_48200 [soil metagenome]
MKRVLPALFVAFCLLAATASKAAPPMALPDGAHAHHGGSATCGDYKCDPPEDCKSCPQDCGSCCGNSKCEPPEDCNSCPRDCGSCK